MSVAEKKNQHAGAVPIIRIEGVSKRFGDFVAVDSIDLDIERGEIFSILGASGCGKTTLLRMLAGFETPTTGRIIIDGVDLTNEPPYRRPVNLMFQSYAIFPHMTVEQNVAYGLRKERVPRDEVKSRVAEMLDLVQLQQFATRKPNQLSGGQRQRVALARALVKRPKVLLLDEPLAALDKKLREHTQFELMGIQDRLGITFVVVTHDQEEAMILSSRIAVMNEGRFDQVGRPKEVYEYPVSRFVADFIGTINMFEGTVETVSGGVIAVRCDPAGTIMRAMSSEAPA
ncbi:MAG: ABC transporter ATP-binding protein, partial [Woeseiaceae bacterium]